LIALPTSIRDQKWPEDTKPLVSIFCLTFNHGKYIRDAIEGFLMQQTTFPIEIFIHDDASKDDTQEILKEYQCRHQKIITTYFQKENQWSKDFSKTFFHHLFRQRGTFVAFCEGDDYWTDPYKLERQVEHFRQNPDVRLVCTQYSVKRGDEIQKPDFLFRRTVTRQNWTFPYSLSTATAMFRLRDLAEGFPAKPPKHAKDIVLWRLLLQKGDAHVLQEPTAVYRIHDQGVWSCQPEFRRGLANLQSARTMLRLLGNTEPDLTEFFTGSLKDSLRHLDQSCPEERRLLWKIAIGSNLRNSLRMLKAWFQFALKRRP
jgi:hypothetical protein